jgi:hypothetical protein
MLAKGSKGRYDAASGRGVSSQRGASRSWGLYYQPPCGMMVYKSEERDIQEAKAD